eukprot:31139_1
MVTPGRLRYSSYHCQCRSMKRLYHCQGLTGPIVWTIFGPRPDGTVMFHVDEAKKEPNIAVVFGGKDSALSLQLLTRRKAQWAFGVKDSAGIEHLVAGEDAVHEALLSCVVRGKDMDQGHVLKEVIIWVDNHD